ncbi:F-box domain-containing protein [Favolaschia claudopus]|uniref:F-box domain-containing protein n=1 Tax=Favolaschia claudopus TaxID=2862362 RepID=A0AAW0APG2_9AGAR
MLDFLAADRAFLAEYDAEIQALEAQVAAIKSSISLLRAAQRTARQRLRSYKYPVLTLPNEMIAEIFLRFLPLYPDVQPLLGDLSPMRLTQICRQWRDIACNTPQLWTAIDLNPRNVDLPTSLEGTLALTALWVSRSGNCPLSIRMGSQHDPMSILALLIPHRHRWEHLTLTLESTRPLSLIQCSLPLLKSLTVHLGSSISDNKVVSLQYLPLLSTVTLDDYKIPHISLPWSQLTSLTLSWIYPEHCMSILRKTARLERCTLLLWMQDEPENEFVVDLVLPCLETLEVEVDEGVHVNLMQGLVAPALHYLRLPESFLGSNPIKSLESFISRSRCHIDKLQVTEASVSHNAYRNAFPSIPDVNVEKYSDSYSD